MLSAGPRCFPVMTHVRAWEQCATLFLDRAAVIALCQEDPELGVTLLRRVLEIVSQRVCGLE